MRRKIDLIYCGNGNKRFAQIAIERGFLYGAQLPGKTYYDIYFADQNWKKPDRRKYMEEVKKRKPHMASVLDWEKWSQYCIVMEWAEEIAPYVDEVMIVPKIPNSVQSIPNIIGGKKVRIGYSVPTRYGGSTINLRELALRPVHLLGGSPHAQLALYTKIPNIVSADGNYHQKIAIMNKVWIHGSKRVMGRWEKLSDYLGYEVKDDAPYVAFDISCKNMKDAWEKIQHDI